MGGASQEIIESLRSVYDPCCRERDISVVDMGLVRSASLEEGEARVELMLTSGWCPYATQLLDSITEKLEEIKGVSSASVDIVWDEAWTMDRLSDDARHKLVFLPKPVTIEDRNRYVEMHSSTQADSRRSQT
ncbi:MAG: DUF59 domain-containing protein [Actinobacteria bacterium]|nr:DUF59 domain-containing protein [Actinomycetota bacterium]